MGYDSSQEAAFVRIWEKKYKEALKCLLCIDNGGLFLFLELVQSNVNLIRFPTQTRSPGRTPVLITPSTSESSMALLNRVGRFQSLHELGVLQTRDPEAQQIPS